MTTTWIGRVVGTFLGYKGGRGYDLSDGTSWYQDDHTDEPVYRENPTAKLLSDGMGHTYLDVEGTSARVRVMPVGRRPVQRAGAF